MFEFEKVCREYELLTYDERRDILRELADIIVPAVAAITDGTDAFFLLASAACAADGKLGVDEYSLFKDSTGLDISYDEAAETIRQIKGKDLNEQADAVVDMFGTLDEKIKDAMVCYCACICSADNRIGLKERSFIRKLIKD